jgi:hypothetical protein
MGLRGQVGGGASVAGATRARHALSVPWAEAARLPSGHRSAMGRGERRRLGKTLAKNVQTPLAPRSGVPDFSRP